MRRFDRNEVIAALAMMAFALFWFAIGLRYSLGTGVRIGAGVFPVALSVILMVLCATLVVQARGAEYRSFALRLRPVALILGGVLAWALLVDVTGFLPATAILVAMCAMAETESTLLSAAGLTVFLCAFGYAVFIEGLNIPLSVLGE